VTPAADGPPAQSLPRGVLGGLALLHAVVFGGAAFTLPWSLASAFTVLAGIVAAGFLAMAVCAVALPGRLPVAFRAASAIAISFLLWATWSLASAGAYLIGLYGGVGAGLAGAAGAAWCVVALFTLPLGAWGLAATGGLGLRRRSRPAAAPVAVAVAVLITASLLAWRASAARGRERVEGADPRAVVAAALEAAGAEGKRSRRGGKKRGADSLFLDGVVICEVAPASSPFTLLAVARVPGGKVTPLCGQGETLEAAAAALATALREVGDPDQVVAAIDVLREIAPVPERGPLLGAVSVRPGLDGVCAGTHCLPPWLAVARQQFTTMASFPSVQLDLGASASALRQALGSPAGDTFDGIDRFSSTELLLRGGELTTLERGRLPSPPPVDEETLSARSRAALGFIIASQERDGRFRYLVDPHAGTASFANFSIPRQAGTTLVVCEMAALDERAVATARKSLKMLAGLERRDGERGGIVWPRGSTRAMPLGNTALSMIAFLACRDRVGGEHDALIHRMGRLLLAMQRESGSFGPSFDPATGVRGTGDPMYAEGQVVMALVLWEAMIASGAAPDEAAGPAPEALRGAIDRAMAHFAGPYWDFVVRDFFFFEENWHCLAARAALATHRRDDYERFCLDYVTMKARLVHDQATGSEARLVGAYGFGTLFPPHNTATAGFGEALAAAMAVARARGAQRPEDEARMREVLAYLMQQQWTEETCFACSDTIPIPGAFSEHFGEPTIRIDYVQHALAALGHGGHVLGLLPQVRAAGEATGP
jgi:hypothetical protein